MRSLRLALALLMMAPVVSQAFVLYASGSNNYLRWQLANLNLNVPTNSLNRTTRAIRYYLASDGYSATNAAAELNALRASFGQWLAITNTTLKFEEAGVLNPPVDVSTVDGTNILYWAKTSTSVNNGGSSIAGALGVTFFSSFASDGAISQADIVFNGVEETWFTDITDVNSTSYFIEGVALHEIGHMLGLRHSPLGGATMLYAGGDGISLQSGLSQDEVAAARFLYPTNTSVFGTISGTITRAGSNVFGAAVYLQNSVTNIVQGTVSQTNGTYLFKSVLPGTYHVRVAPLDATSASAFLASGNQIGNPVFSGADPFFLPTTNITTTVVANTTNTINFIVTSNAPAFRITKIRDATSSSGSYAWSSLPVKMTVGQSNYFIGVASANLPTSGATLTITGNGLTVGATTFLPNAFSSGLNFMSVPISVASNAAPGLRSFVVTQGANVAYANGYLEILPAVSDDNFDGLDDLFQRTYFPVFTTNAAAPASDPDGDGFNNYAESISGSIPTNSASFLKIQSITRNVSGATIFWPSAAGKRYQVSTLTNAASGSWANIGSVVTAVGTTSQYLDSTATNATKFYRVQALP